MFEFFVSFQSEGKLFNLDKSNNSIETSSGNTSKLSKRESLKVRRHPPSKSSFFRPFPSLLLWFSLIVPSIILWFFLCVFHPFPRAFSRFKERANYLDYSRIFSNDLVLDSSPCIIIASSAGAFTEMKNLIAFPVFTDQCTCRRRITREFHCVDRSDLGTNGSPINRWRMGHMPCCKYDYI